MDTIKQSGTRLSLRRQAMTSIPRVVRIALGVCAFTLLLLVAAGDAWAAPLTVEAAARSLVGERGLTVVFERWNTNDYFIVADLREGTCVAYTARKTRCRYVITGRAAYRRILTYVEHGWVKVRCARRCEAFRLSVTDRTQAPLDRDGFDPVVS